MNGYFRSKYNYKYVFYFSHFSPLFFFSTYFFFIIYFKLLFSIHNKYTMVWVILLPR